MLQYKTTCIPNPCYRGVEKSEFKHGLTVETGNKAIAPIGQAIQNEAKGGWSLHSIECLPQKIARKKGILEKLLGWIPILGSWLFPSMLRECYDGVDFYMYVLVFVKEV
ncbi:MAG: hypothetical protein LUD27_07755 [Clostridia bacterium]|nr:hypothetical protein [Clostridia bacterium]